MKKKKVTGYKLQDKRQKLKVKGRKPKGKCFYFLAVLIVVYMAYECYCHSGSVESLPAAKVIKADSIKLIFAGDVMGHITQVHGAKYDGGDTVYDYNPAFQSIKDYIFRADIAVANLEVVLAGKPYSGYPFFSSPDALAQSLTDNGFDVLVTANNHSLDRGKKGLERTIDVLERLKMAHTGTFTDSLERKSNYPLIIKRKNFKLALLNCTYGTNGQVEESPTIVNRMDTVQIGKDIQKAKQDSIDYLIMYVHWGREYSREVSKNQRKVAAFLARSGCDLVIGSHPHVVQPFELLPAEDSAGFVPVVYSLGNFISNQRDRYRDGGIAFEVDLIKTDTSVTAVSFRYEPFWVYRFKPQNASVFRLIPVNEYKRDSTNFMMSEEHRKQMMQFYDDTKEVFNNLDFSGYYK